jgi:hypothetical protein
LKLIIEIDLNRVSHDYFSGKVSVHDAADLVKEAAERVRLMETEDLRSGSWRIKDSSDRTVGSVTIQEDDGGGL